MSKHLGNAALIASSATFTLLVFQVFAAVPPVAKPLNSPHLAHSPMPNIPVSGDRYAQSDGIISPLE
jgi:hypothetical protein